MELGNLMFGNNRNENLVYNVDRDFIDKFEDVLDVLGLSFYGYPKDKDSDYIIDENNVIYGIKDVIEIYPYQWLDENQIDTIPNLKLPQYNIIINWYKCPFRDAYSNKQVLLNEWNQIIEEILLYIIKRHLILKNNIYNKQFINNKMMYKKNYRI